MKFSNVVLGGGPVGLALASIHRYALVTDEIKIPEGPVYLYRTQSTKKFLEKLGYYFPKVKTINIGYFYKGQLYEHPPREALEEYSSKTLRDKIYFPRRFEYYDIDWETLAKLEMHNISKVIFGKVGSIDVEKQIVSIPNGIDIEYKKLISTVPAPVFEKMANQKFDLKYLPVRMYECVVNNLTSWERFDYVYICDKDDYCLRWSNGKMEEIAHFGTVANQYKITGGHVPDILNVKFAGRFARWQEDRLISDEIGEAINA